MHIINKILPSYYLKMCRYLEIDIFSASKMQFKQAKALKKSIYIFFLLSLCTRYYCLVELS